MKLSAINFRKYFLLAGIVLIVIGIVLAPYDSIKTDITSQKVQFPSQIDEVPIKGNLYLPQNYNTTQSYPAVVLVHGINDVADRFHHMAVEFVRRGFIVLAIYLRGHDSSGGICSLSAKEPWDIMGAADYLLENYNISNLGLVGHSLGGMSSIRAAHNDTRFNATVVMGPPISFQVVFTRYVPDFDVLLPYLYLLSFHFDFSDPYEQYLRTPVFWINQTSPRNLFYILGGRDTAATPEEALLCIQNATGNSSVEVNVAYGNFADGNRTMLKIYPGIDHGSEPVTPAIVRDTVLWVEGALNITNGDLTLEELIQWNLSPWGGYLITIGFFLSVFPAISYICTTVCDPSKIAEPENARSLKGKQKILSLGLYTAAFIGASVITFPVIIALNYVDWSIYNIAGSLANVLTIQGIFLALAFIAIIFFERRYYNLTWVDFGINKRTTLKAILIGILISCFLIFGYFFLPNMTAPWFFKFPDWFAFVLIFLNFLFVALIGEMYLRGLIQTKFFKEETRVRNWFNLVFVAIIGGLIQGGSVFFLLLPVPTLTLTFGDLTLNLYLLGFLGGVAIFTALGILNGWIFLKTKHVLSAAIVEAAILSWLLTTFMIPL